MKSLFIFIKPLTLLILGLLGIYLLNPFNYGYLFGYILAVIIISKSSFLVENLDMDLIMILLFSTTYALFYSFDFESQGKQFIAIYAITPPTFYLLGKYLVKDRPNIQALFYLLFGIAVMFSMTAAVSVFLNFMQGGFVQIERTIGLFWDNRPVSATTMGSFFTLTMCTPALLILGGGKKDVFFKIAALFVFTISLICCIRLGSRTQLGVFLITTILAILYVVPRQSIKKNITLIILLGLIGYYISTKVSFNLNADWLTTFSDRMGKQGSDISSGGGRTERWVKSLEYLFKYPLGWDYNEFGHAHNFWLDVLRVTGIVPFFILLISTVKSINQIRLAIKVNKQAIALNGQILVYGFAFFMVFMVEPVMDGIFMTFVVFCVYQGIINKYKSNFLEENSSANLSYTKNNI
ncbi:O-antigen ligase family protein [Maribacter dokdonensis]|uniref:O-antigen ligase family protein n=1 Tax=Maribacter dokdonensis TaxID=320912 RepID=UPI002AAF5141|nr:hypothetical protein [Maribacter dokdonensis]